MAVSCPICGDMLPTKDHKHHCNFEAQFLESYEDWELNANMNITFKNVVLKVDIGTFKKGERVREVKVNLERLLIFISNTEDHDDADELELILSVRKSLKN